MLAHDIDMKSPKSNQLYHLHLRPSVLPNALHLRRESQMAVFLAIVGALRGCRQDYNTNVPHIRWVHQGNQGHLESTQGPQDLDVLVYRASAKVEGLE